MRVTVEDDGASVLLQGRVWAERILPAQLPGRLAFYRALRDRARGQYATHYALTVAGLEAAQRQIAGGGR
jgi:hypothetical protein